MASNGDRFKTPLFINKIRTKQGEKRVGGGGGGGGGNGTDDISGYLRPSSVYDAMSGDHDQESNGL